jgi:hypothetical protein
MRIKAQRPSLSVVLFNQALFIEKIGRISSVNSFLIVPHLYYRYAFMQNTLTLSMRLDASVWISDSSNRDIPNISTDSAFLLDHRLPANELASRFNELVQIAKVDDRGRLQPISQNKIKPIADSNTAFGQPTFSDPKSEDDFPRLEKGWKRSSVRGSVYRTDDQNVMRTHAWGPRNEDNYDESVFSDGYTIRRDREGATFECFPVNEGKQYFRLTRLDGRQFCWEGTSRNYEEMGITLVESVPDQVICKYQDHAEDIGLKFSRSNCVRVNWSQGV